MSEHHEQALVVRWAELNQKRLPGLELLHAIPNGGDRHPAVAAKMRAEGVRSGVPDLALPVPVPPYCGLYLEMKTKRPRQTKTKGVRWAKTSTTPAQEAWIAGLRAVGHAVEVCYSAEEAQATIEAYLTGRYEPRHGATVEPEPRSA